VCNSGDIASRGNTVVVRLRGTLRRGDVLTDSQLLPREGKFRRTDSCSSTWNYSKFDY
jgi:hypothetical protein